MASEFASSKGGKRNGMEELYMIDDDPGRREFLDGLNVFLANNHTQIHRLPIMAKSVLDLYTLWKLVIARGGIVSVINRKQWQEVIKGLNLPSSITSAAYTLREQYVKYLFGYESEIHGFNSRDELEKAINNNRRDSKRSHKTAFEHQQPSTCAMAMADMGMPNIPDTSAQQMNSILPILALLQAQNAARANEVDNFGSLNPFNALNPLNALNGFNAFNPLNALSGLNAFGGLNPMNGLNMNGANPFGAINPMQLLGLSLLQQMRNNDSQQNANNVTPTTRADIPTPPNMGVDETLLDTSMLRTPPSRNRSTGMNGRVIRNLETALNAQSESMNARNENMNDCNESMDGQSENDVAENMNGHEESIHGFNEVSGDEHDKVMNHLKEILKENNVMDGDTENMNSSNHAVNGVEEEKELEMPRKLPKLEIVDAHNIAKTSFNGKVRRESETSNGSNGAGETSSDDDKENSPVSFELKLTLEEKEQPKIAKEMENDGSLNEVARAMTIIKHEMSMSALE